MATIAVLTAAAPAASPAATAPAWHTAIMAKPASTPAAPLTETGLACPAPTACWLVGYSQNGPALSTNVAEHFDGTNWSSVNLPTPLGWTQGQPRAISCADVSNCTAVGIDSRANQSGVFIDTWTGTSWSALQLGLPTAAKVVPTSIACPAPANCMVVGNLTTAAGSVRAFADRLFGGLSGFAQLPAASPLATTTLASDVSCPSTSICEAVGAWVGYSRVTTPIAWRFDGSWAATVPEVSNGDLSGSLGAVSCPNETACVAVGTQANATARQGLVETFDLGSWSPIAVSDSGLTLADVSCSDVTDCVSVGDASTMTLAGVKNTFVAATEASGVWTTKSVGPTPFITPGGRFVQLACDSPASCTAINVVSLDPYTTVIDAYSETNGAWSWSNIPLPPGPADFRMVGDACIDSSTCVAVGSYFPGPASVIGSTGGPVIEMRHGGSWQNVAISQPSGGLFGALYSVSCANESDCEAVGWEQVQGFSSATNNYFLAMHPLTAHYDGASWTVSMLPDPSDGLVEGLSSVSCPAPGECVATGIVHNLATNVTRALAAKLTNGAWSLRVLPVAAQEFGSATAMLLMPDSLSGVSCPSARYCVAVQPTTNGTGTATEVYDGSAWHISWVPRLRGEPLVTLNSIQCFGATRCYAVGANANRAIADILDRSRWHQVPLSVRGPSSFARLHAISCAKFSYCMAVGEYTLSSNVSVPFAASMTRLGWRTASLPRQLVPWQSAPWEDNEMWGVSCPQSVACTASGYASSFDVAYGAAQSLR
jgi:hypothetical protein